MTALDRMNVGDHAQRTAGLNDRIGQPLEASTNHVQLSAIRRFFADCQEWELLPRRFDPQNARWQPRAVSPRWLPNQRVTSDELWAKLLWAGLNLDGDNLAPTQVGHFYPVELFRVVTLTWLFSGQRSSEIARPRRAASAGSKTKRPSTATRSRSSPETRSACSTSPPKTGPAFTNTG
ncbi:MAG TPA: hypothetical protein VM677_25730 [Actinokineospora sp.]|nr:hypothetical protein [Actinokineospora sp.]